MTTLTTPYWPTRDLPVNGHQPIHPLGLAQRTEEPAISARRVKLDADLETAARHASYMRTGFYGLVLAVALAGQVTGAVEKLNIPLLAAAPAVAALELGGIVVMQNADVRRRLGERATASRVLSALIAAWAVAFNWLAHDNHLLGGFFAGMSALGYLVWLMHTENQRRDRLRATGDLPPTTPAYEFLGHWVRHPWLTLRAKNLAKADDRLGLYTSLDAARAAKRREVRTRAISKVLHRDIRAAVDPTTADIAVAVYDLDEIAARLKERADYDGLTDMIAVRLDPAHFGDRAAQVGVAQVAPTVSAHPAAHAGELPTAHPALEQPTSQPTPNTDDNPAQAPTSAGSSMGVDAPNPPKTTPRPRAPRAAQPSRPAQSPTPIPGLTALQQQRLTDLGREFPGDLPGRDKVMAHMRTQGYEGWTSKEPARTLINLLRAQRESAQPTSQPTPTKEAS